MTLYYCGWNGCGQSIGHSSIICEPVQLVFDAPIVSVSCSWSVLSVATEKTLTVMGFIGNSPNSSKVIPLGDDTKAVQVSSTLNHTLIVTNNGKCYTYNPETDNLRKIVKFSNVEISLTDSKDPVEDPIINVSCGGHTNLALSKTGRVFAIPCLINLPKLKVTDVSCGNEHSILLTETGSVFTWGCSSRGQLGHGDLETEEKPRQVEVLSGLEVLFISAGSWHNAVVTSTGDLYTWGWGSDGQLGVQEDQEEVGEDEQWKVKSDNKLTTDPEKSEKYRGVVQTYPVPVDTPVDVHSVSCGSRHTLVLLVDGSVWGCGWNAYGQLAFPPTKFTRLITLQKLIIPALEKRISKIQCGAWSSCFVEGLN